MKLYLSSYQLGNDPAQLASLISGSRRIGVIRNSLDFSNDVERLQLGKEREFAGLKSIGLTPEALDLRDFFSDPHALRSCIDELNGLWVVGGNTFILRRAMKQSGLDSILVEKARDDNFVYAGYSAGACVATPTLNGIHLVDNPEIVPPGYLPEIIWEGLALVPFSIAPHYQSNHPESEMIEETVAFFIKNKMPFIALQDGEVFTADGVFRSPSPGSFPTPR